MAHFQIPIAAESACEIYKLYTLTVWELNIVAEIYRLEKLLLAG